MRWVKPTEVDEVLKGDSDLSSLGMMVHAMTNMGVLLEVVVCTMGRMRPPEVSVSFVRFIGMLRGEWDSLGIWLAP
ncbi:hypothetical protein AMTR_s00116p00126230 [Amborella trichopoda]|uniref:Uncharacterized protein n=1 Tax=Amborella trichopoda TaxID=13333 RepID=W1NSK4_AMBTC|nr:hypothetical protein AMTR_s00116p00126230 [Amborella trichopoda]